jgi:hypothetical protein
MVDKHGKHYFLEVNPRVQVRQATAASSSGRSSRSSNNWGRIKDMDWD